MINESEYKWYDQVDYNQPIYQGDLIPNCPILIPVSPEEIGKENIKSNIQEYNIIVMSQSCDLLAKKISIVLVCPAWSLNELEKENKKFGDPKSKEALRKGRHTSLHLLNKCEYEPFKDQFIVIDFRNIYGINFSYLESYVKTIGSRVRLLPPYREHLSQSFARYFMRVGLPLDIPSFT